MRDQDEANDNLPGVLYISSLLDRTILSVISTATARSDDGTIVSMEALRLVEPPASLRFYVRPFNLQNHVVVATIIYVHSIASTSD